MAFLKFFDSNSCHSSDGFKVYNLPIWCKYWWRCSARASFHVTRSPLVVTRFTDVAPENKASLVTSTTLNMYIGKQTFRQKFVKLWYMICEQDPSVETKAPKTNKMIIIRALQMHCQMNLGDVKCWCSCFGSLVSVLGPRPICKWYHKK